MNNLFCKPGSIKLTYEGIPFYIQFNCNEITFKRKGVRKPITLKRKGVRKPITLKRISCESNSIGDCWVCDNLYVIPGRERSVITFKSKHYFIYHFTYGLFNNIPLEKLKYRLLRHRRDNSMCNNSNHLLPGTHIENMRDMVERERSCRGEKNYNAVLNEMVVQRIFESDYPVSCLAEIYNVTENTIRLIKSRKTWKHVRVQNEKDYGYLDNLL